MYNILRKLHGLQNNTEYSLCIRDSVTCHCNYGRPFALSVRPFRIDHPAARLPARPDGRKLVSIFTRHIYRLHTHCRFEQHGILSITLSLCFIRISLLMERMSRVDGSDEKTHAVLRALLSRCLRYSMMEDYVGSS